VIEVAGGVAVTITDMAGRQVCRQDAVEGAWAVDVRNWGRGIYQVQVSSERGYRTTGKLIVR